MSKTDHDKHLPHNLMPGDHLRGTATFSCRQGDETVEGEFRGTFGDDVGLNEWPEVHRDDGRRVFLDPSKPITTIRPAETPATEGRAVAVGSLSELSARLVRTANSVMGHDTVHTHDVATAQALAAVLAEPALAHFLRLGPHQRRWLTNLAHKIGHAE